jgi:serine protease
MKTKMLLAAACVAAALTVSAQTYQPGKVWVIVNDSTIIPEDGKGESRNPAFSAVLANFGVDHVTRPMSFAKTPALRRLVELNTTSSEDELFTALTALNASDHLFLSVEKCPVPQVMSNPADYMWYLTTVDPTTWLWHLKKMQADLAWDITKGCPNVKVAITDDGVDISHPDLANKIYPPQPFSAPGGTPFSVGGHGTAVASFIGAETIDAGQPQNAGALASVGYNTRVMVDYMGTANCVYASSVLGAQIISLSWFWSCTPTASDLLAEQEILGNGTTIIKAAANGFGHCGGNRVYPFSGFEDPRTIVISSTGKDDKHYDTYGTGGGTHSHYKEVDLCAPGYGVVGATPPQPLNGGYQYMAIGGTSFAAPQVAGVAALMYCVNPCLTSATCQDILKNTTDPIVDATSYPGKVGTGRVNAFKAVRAAQGMHSSTLDLYMKDRPEDLGYGIYSNFPYHWQASRDKSPDIWVRNQPDGLTNQVNQNPTYSATQPAYVYVRVWNKSCDQSFGQGKLKLYWTKASTNSSWTDGYWDGSYDPTVGNVIGSQSIPNIGPGESTILQFQWTILDPTIYQNWSTCLLARIDNITVDPIVSYPNNLSDEVFFNNNVAMRNISVLNATPVVDPNNNPNEFVSIKDMTRGSFMYIGNVDKDPKTYNIRFGLPVDESSPSIIDQGEVHVIVDNRGWEIMEAAIAALVASGDVSIVGPNHLKILKDAVTFPNLDFPAGIRSQIYVGFNFLTDDASDDNSYLYQVFQSSLQDAGEHPEGSENFIVEKKERARFYADAGNDETIHAGESVTLHASDIGEDATYNWYAADGSLEQSGKDITVNPGSSARYRLEVIAAADAYKDYDFANVIVKQAWIEQISPNPTDVSTVVSYHIGTAGGELKLNSQSGTVMKTYTLSSNSTSQEVDVTECIAGMYTVVLEVNGVIVDSKLLMVQ